MIWWLLHGFFQNYLNVWLLNKFVLWLPNCNVIFKLYSKFFFCSAYMSTLAMLSERSFYNVWRLSFPFMNSFILLVCNLEIFIFRLFLLGIFIFYISLVLQGFSALPFISMFVHKAMMSLLNLLEFIFLLWYFPLMCSQ